MQNDESFKEDSLGYLLHGVEIAVGVPLVIVEKEVLRVTQYSAEAECLEVCYAAAEWIPLRFWNLKEFLILECEQGW